MAFILMRSTTPLKFSSAPIGHCTGTGLPPKRFLICSTTRAKLAPTRSILLTKARRGTLYLLAWRHTVSDWGWTPPTAQNTAQAPAGARGGRAAAGGGAAGPG